MDFNQSIKSSLKCPKFKKNITRVPNRRIKAHKHTKTWQLECTHKQKRFQHLWDLRCMYWWLPCTSARTTELNDRIQNVWHATRISSSVQLASSSRKHSDGRPAANSRSLLSSNPARRFTPDSNRLTTLFAIKNWQKFFVPCDGRLISTKVSLMAVPKIYSYSTTT